MFGGQTADTRRLALEQLDRLERCDREYFGSEAQRIVDDWLGRVVRRMADDSEELGSDGSAVVALAQLAHQWGHSATAMEILQLPGGGSTHAYAWFHLAATISLDLQQPEAALAYLDTVRPGLSDQHWDNATRLKTLLILGQFDKANQAQRAHWMRMSA